MTPNKPKFQGNSKGTPICFKSTGHSPTQLGFNYNCYFFFTRNLNEPTQVSSLSSIPFQSLNLELNYVKLNKASIRVLDREMEKYEAKWLK